jgi:AcrR family transcriptional regulator
VPDVVLSRRDRERLARRRAMLDAARAVFAERGFEQATLDEVAERAEFGKGTLYNYFPGGKDEILRAVLEDLFDGVEAVVEAEIAAHDAHPAHETVHAVLVAMMSYFERNRDTFLVVVKEVQRLMLDAETDAQRWVWERDERVVRMLEAPIERGIAAGTLRPFPAEAVARTILGNLHGMLMHSVCDPRGSDRFFPSPEAAAGFIMSILFDGLRPR